MNQEQLNYVKSQLQNGVPEDTIRTNLRSNNYSEELIENLFTEAKNNVTEVPPQLQQKEGLKWWQITLIVLGILFFVVPFVFGILSSVILASLNSARDKGADAANMATINNARVWAELHFDDAGGSYLGACQAVENEIQEDTFLDDYECSDTSETYMIYTELSDKSYYCVDSTGYAEQMLTAPLGQTCTGEVSSSRDVNADQMVNPSTETDNFESNSDLVSDLASRSAYIVDINDTSITLDFVESTQWPTQNDDVVQETFALANNPTLTSGRGPTTIELIRTDVLRYSPRLNESGQPLATIDFTEDSLSGGSSIVVSGVDLMFSP